MDASLFDPPSHRNAPRGTSELAAKSVRESAESMRRRVLAYLTQQGERGATDEEIQIALEMSGNTQRPRRWELQNADVIKDSGKRRPNKSGRAAAVWVVEEAR